MGYVRETSSSSVVGRIRLAIVCEIFVYWIQA